MFKSLPFFRSTFFKCPIYLAICLSVLLTGCASTPEHGEKTADPWEKVNRPIFVFNDRLDAWVAKPIAKGYVAIAPNFVEVGVDNFFDNVMEVSNVVNSLLQAKWSRAGYDSSRFVLNTLGGLGGLVDVAAEAGLPQNPREDFGQTLRTWGVPQGPYLVLPFLGPSTVTDAVGRVVDLGLTPTNYIKSDPLVYGVTILDYTNTRAGLLDVEELVSGDKYTFFREAYLQNRIYLLNDGVVEDDFGGDSDDFDF